MSTAAQPVLQLERIHKRFHTHHVLKGVDLTVSLESLSFYLAHGDIEDAEE